MSISSSTFSVTTDRLAWPVCCFTISNDDVAIAPNEPWSELVSLGEYLSSVCAFTMIQSRVVATARTIASLLRRIHKSVLVADVADADTSPKLSARYCPRCSKYTTSLIEQVAIGARRPQNNVLQLLPDPPN